MAYTLIAKLDKFNGEEDNAQVWLNDMAKAITANNWDDARAMQYQSFTVKLQNFNGFKTEFLQYFSNNNSINKLTNTFTMIKQVDTKAVTTYLGCFYKNLRQIQAIQVDYFTAPQILNQFIRRLCSSILQRICSMHPIDLPTAVTYTRDFKAAELEANHIQALTIAQFINLFNGITIKKIHVYHRHPISHGSQRHASATTVVNKVPDSEPSPESRPIPTYLSVYNTPTNLSTASLSTATTSNLSSTATSNISTAATSNLSNTYHSNTTSKPSSNDIREPKIKDHPKLEISNGCTLTNLQLFSPTIRILSVEFGHHNQRIEQQQPPTNNISPATITENKSLDAIFSFELKKPSDMLLFSGAALEEKLITAMYTDAKIDDHFIKLIFDSNQLGYQVDCAVSTRIITADGATKTPIGKIDDFSIEVNSIVVPIKVLATNTTALLIDFKEDKPKPTWEAYQVSWTDEEHNKLLPILSWDDNRKSKQREKPIWKTDNLIWTDYDKSKPTTSWGKGKEKEKKVTTTTHNLYAYTISHQSTYHCSKLICTDCGKKLSLMGTCCGNNEEYQQLDNTLCLACGKTLLDKGMWNNISGRRGMYDELCQYTILISNWIRKGTPIKATWR
ncbi:hypothetical protein G9A89_012181 [Geosiphon pyriformis]|nr:hypothetical protein G9A89_012181 [Geosiphon pyriformis]